MIDDITTLLFLILLQAVLGFDNLLYISLESKRAPEKDRARVRQLGIGIAIGARIALLFVLVKLIGAVQAPLFSIDTAWIKGAFSVHALIVLAGGAFIMWTAVKEIWHMIGIDEHALERESTAPKSAGSVIAMIVVMNLVFSFDSILSAMALTETFWVMAAAIVASGVLMIAFANHVSAFLAKNRMYEVLGLFILLIVGVMLLGDGGHLAKLVLFGGEVHPMSKATFYFVIAVLVLTDIVQSRYQRKLRREALASKPSTDA